MRVQDFLAGAARRALNLLGANVTTPQKVIDSFYCQVDSKSMQSCATSQVAKLFYSHQGRLIHKWGHYLEIYDRHLRDYQKLGRPVRLLEIGVYHGGSLQLWRQYFGPEAVIFGVDIDPRCRDIADPNICIRIGSQADAEFLRRVVQEMGGVDIVIDDGSHIASHQRKSLEVLLPLVDPNGIYIAEDLHTSYFRGPFDGGFRRRGTFIEEAKMLIDGIYQPYHKRETSFSSVHASVNSVHFYDGLVAIEKKPHQAPFHTKVGTPSFRKD